MKLSLKLSGLILGCLIATFSVKTAENGKPQTQFDRETDAKIARALAAAAVEQSSMDVQSDKQKVEGQPSGTQELSKLSFDDLYDTNNAQTNETVAGEFYETFFKLIETNDIAQLKSFFEKNKAPMKAIDFDINAVRVTDSNHTNFCETVVETAYTLALANNFHEVAKFLKQQGADTNVALRKTEKISHLKQSQMGSKKPNTSRQPSRKKFRGLNDYYSW